MGGGDKASKDIVSKMMRNYAACTSYQDEGVYISTFTRKNGDTEFRRKPFKTYYVRPDFFRLEWTEPWPRYKEPGLCVLWSAGHGTYFYRQVFCQNFPDRLEHERDLRWGLHNTTSLAGGPSQLAPVMLLQDISTFLSMHLKNFYLVGEEDIQGVRCYHLSGRFSWLLGIWDMWVGKDDYMLRKLKQESRMKNGYEESEEIHSKIVLDVDIPRKVFDFQPPPGLKVTEARR